MNKYLDQIPIFAISKIAKNQFLKWEKVENCQKCNFTSFFASTFFKFSGRCALARRPIATELVQLS